MTRSRRAVLRDLAALTGAASLPAGAQAAPPLRLRRGVNTWPWFALTREYPAPSTDYAWPPFQSRRPTPTSRDLAALRATGLDFIRLPVDPGPFLAGRQVQREALMETLLAAVRAALAAGLSVVVNIQTNDATHYWRSSRLVASVDAERFADYRDLVAAVAGRLGSLDPARVALEPVNEPPQACVTQTWPLVQDALFRAARTAARDLTLVATGACGSMVSGLVALDPTPLAVFEPLLFTFHFYEPYLFSHQGAPWMQEPVYRALNAVPWPASTGSLKQTLAAVRLRMSRDTAIGQAAKEAAYAQTEKVLKVYFDAQPARPFLDRYLGAVRAWGEGHAIMPGRIVMGEFGALRTDARYTAAGAPDRARYVRDVRESAEQAGFPWAFWNLFDGMGMMDDTSRALDPAIVASLGLRMPPR